MLFTLGRCGVPAYRIQRLLQNGLITPQHRHARQQRQTTRRDVAALRAHYACFSAEFETAPDQSPIRGRSSHPEAHALGDLEAQDGAPLDLLASLPKWKESLRLRPRLGEETNTSHL
jgi:hypothetical protein